MKKYNTANKINKEVSNFNLNCIKFFQNPENLPLEKLELIIHENGVPQCIPAIVIIYFL